MPSIRFSQNVLAKVMSKAPQGVTEKQLIDAALKVDNGNKYLNRSELTAGLEAIKGNAADPLERMLDESRANFIADTQRELRDRGALGIPQLQTLRFHLATAGTPAAGERDARIDETAHKIASALRRHGFTVKLTGADDGADVLRGIIPRAWNGGQTQGRTFGEVYNILDLKIPGVRGEHKIGVMRVREHNEWNGGSYTQDEAELRLVFIDKNTNKSWGSGWLLDDGILGAPAGAVSAHRDALVDQVVEQLLEFQRLNRR